MRGALDRTGHRSDLFLVGELAPLGGGATRTPPATFLRQLFCLRENGKRMRGAEARLQGCRRVKPLRVSGVSDHPYARGAGVPTGRRQRKGAITVGTIGRFVPILHSIKRHSPLTHRSLPVYLTEFGVTTRPPDVKFGVRPNRQAQYLNLVDYLAYKRPWIKSVSQFQLADVRVGHLLHDGVVHADAVIGGDVERGVRALHALLYRGRIGQVARDKLAAERAQGVRLLRRAHQAHDLVAARAQFRGHPAADESGPTGQESSHVRGTLAIVGRV